MTSTQQPKQELPKLARRSRRLAYVRERLAGVDQVVLGPNNVFTVRRGFFYRSGGSAEQLAQRVREAFPEATVLDAGEVWKEFVGGAPLQRQSHWYVKFTL